VCKIAILYQDKPPPLINGLQKPMKPNGYADSGADIAYELRKNEISIVTPVDNPKTLNDFDWVFPDTEDGILSAYGKGARIFWLNTVLYKNHSIEKFFDYNIEIVGQIPREVGIYDDKWTTNRLLKENRISIPEAQLIFNKNISDFKLKFNFPLIVKPIRGRGSQGVSFVQNKKKLNIKLDELFSSEQYGTSVYIEQFLSGQEITVTVMPSGNYLIDNKQEIFEKPWCLPAIKRFNHENHIAPYNGIVAVVQNSAVLKKRELNSDKILDVYQQCEKAAELLKIKAPIRIDCRANEKGKFFLFDLNMKPNMTGPSRPQRQNQDSLSLIAAREIGWNYVELLRNMLRQKWNPNYL